jgi:hypothetical protein
MNGGERLMEFSDLKAKILALLREDEEFRYAVAGMLGFDEILRRLEKHDEKFEEILRRLDRHEAELLKLREDMVAGFRRNDEEIAKLRSDMVQGFRRHDEEIAKLREDFNRMLALIERMDLRLSRVERTLEKLTIDIEDEARFIVRHKLAEAGINVDLTSLTLPDLELNIYGASNNICVVGEVAVRANARLLNELLEKIEKLRKNYPWMVRDKLIPVLYVALPMADLISEARNRGIWLLKATEEFYRPSSLTREN